MKRNQVFVREKQRQLKEKLSMKKQRKLAEKKDPELREKRLSENQQVTQESKREADVTIDTPGEEEETKDALDQDEFSPYLNNAEAQTKILMTTSRRAPGKVYEFVNEFQSIFPNCQFVKRQSQFDLKKIIEIAIERNYTDLLVINHNNKKADGVMVVHLPSGPSAYFKLTSFIPNKAIRGHATLGPHLPELILNNFNTRLGLTVGRLFQSLFPKHPEFKGRQAVTFHNQRDFIFFRRHRYIFRNGEKVDIQEIGPRFTLKLQWLQNGLFDSKYGEYEWIHKPELDKTRTTFHL